MHQDQEFQFTLQVHVMSESCKIKTKQRGSRKQVNSDLLQTIWQPNLNTVACTPPCSQLPVLHPVLSCLCSTFPAMQVVPPKNKVNYRITWVGKWFLNNDTHQNLLVLNIKSTIQPHVRKKA